MSLIQSLAKMMGSETAQQREAGDALEHCYAAAVRNHRRLAQAAERAPQSASAQGLQELAASEEAVAQRLLDALKAGASTSPQVVATEATAMPNSHWGRLVQALDAQRELVQILREASADLTDSLPATAQLLEELRAMETIHCERLRALIARADPQATD